MQRPPRFPAHLDTQRPLAVLAARPRPSRAAPGDQAADDAPDRAGSGSGPGVTVALLC